MSVSTRGIVFHCEMNVPVIYNSNEDFPICNKPSLRIVLIKKGSGILKVGSCIQAFMAPCILCFNEKESTELVNQTHLLCETISFNPEYINSLFTYEDIWDLFQKIMEVDYYDLYWFRLFVNRTDAYNGYIPLGPHSFSKISELFMKCSEQLQIQPDGYWPCRSRSFFLEILFILDKLDTSNMNAQSLLIDETTKKIIPVILYIHANYQNDLSIPLLSKEFQINRTTLSRLFKKATTCTITEYINSLRISLSTLLLRDTSIPISEIVQHVGFKSITYFERIFFKFLNESPNQYRKKHCWVIK